MKIYDIDTPALLIESSKLKINLKEMQQRCNIKGVKLRPHIKTHKMPKIAKMQLDAGAFGIAVAKLGEAEVFANEGFDDIQLANIIVGDKKIERLFQLSNKVSNLSVCVDSTDGIKQLSHKFDSSVKKLNVMIEIDSGLGRSGLKEKQEILNLVNEIEKASGLNFIGLLTHAGQVYSAESLEEVKKISKWEVDFMSELAEYLISFGKAVNVISIGSTPTSNAYDSLDVISEIRPGNYVFYDMIQVSLGVAKVGQCALSVLSTVISKPTHDRVIIDAGSKSLHTDKGAHGNEKIKTCGHIIDKKASIQRLSEEHGFVYHDGEDFRIGEKIRIIPNHACAVCNLFDFAYLVDGNEIIEKIEISARGKLT